MSGNQGQQTPGGVGCSQTYTSHPELHDLMHPSHSRYAGKRQSWDIDTDDDMNNTIHALESMPSEALMLSTINVAYLLHVHLQ